MYMLYCAAGGRELHRSCKLLGRPVSEEPNLTADGEEGAQPWVQRAL